MKKHIPNTITLCNLVCGCIGVLYAFSGRFEMSLLFVVSGAVFDFFDGFVARKLNVSSPIGKELDSLADVVTFGFAPSAMLFALLTKYVHNYALNAGIDVTSSPIQYINIVAFLVVAFSALRLAKFNLDERQATSFIGLPTPANALLVASIAITLRNHQDWLTALCGNSLSANLLGIVVICVVSVVCSVLLVSEIPMFALKFKSFGWKDNSVRYLFMIVSAALLVVMALMSISRLIAGIGLVIGLYIAISLLTGSKKK